jgi:ABC-type bacteriocin/lantibiotic exporter with double-glycine peptidase domain
MHNIHLLKRSFIRQSSQDTCGVACLGMIFNYAGKPDQVNDINQIPVSEGGLSLYELQTIAFKFGYLARSVEMELTYLRNLGTACILHTQSEQGQNHYQVCYGSRVAGKTYQYLMADPAKQVHWMDEEALAKIWVSRAALYFEDLVMDYSAFQGSHWKALLSLGAFPYGMWVIIPVLTLCSASFGVAMSWVLQRGITDSYFLKTNVFIAIIILLFLISLFKSLFAFLRQYLLISLNMAVNQRLMNALISHLFKSAPVGVESKTAFSIGNSLRDIQKIQNASSEFIATVLSDGALILIFLSAITYLFPLAAFINLIYLVVIATVTYTGLAGNSFNIAHLNHLSATTEKFILLDIENSRSAQLHKSCYNRFKFHQSNHELNINQTRTVAIRASIKALAIEICGTVNVISVFTVCLLQLQWDKLGYGTFMLIIILSYLSTSVVPKICNAVAIIADGADASVQYQSMLSSSSIR